MYLEILSPKIMKTCGLPSFSLISLLLHQITLLFKSSWRDMFRPSILGLSLAQVNSSGQKYFLPPALCFSGGSGNPTLIRPLKFPFESLTGNLFQIIS